MELQRVVEILVENNFVDAELLDYEAGLRTIEDGKTKVDVVHIFPEHQEYRQEFTIAELTENIFLSLIQEKKHVLLKEIIATPLVGMKRMNITFEVKKGTLRQLD